MNHTTALDGTLTRRLPALTAIFSIALLTSCAQFGQPKLDAGAAAPSVTAQAQSEPAPAVVGEEPSKPAPTAQPASNPLYVWKGQGRWVSRMEINVDEQKARFFDGDQEIGWTTIATGLRGYPTPTGKFSVAEKVEEKQSNLYGKIYDRNGRLIRAEAKADVDPVPPGGRFEGAKMPYFLRLTGDGIGLHAGAIPRPGSRASHGCIRMPKGFAPILFEHVKIGTPATIVGDGPPYGTYLAQQQARNQARIARAAKPATPADKGAPATQTPAPEGSAAVAVGTATDKESTAKLTPAPSEGATAAPAKMPHAGESATAVATTTPATTERTAAAAEVAFAGAKPGPTSPEKTPVSGETVTATAKTVPVVSEKKAAAVEPAPAVAKNTAPVPEKAAASSPAVPPASASTPVPAAAAPVATPVPTTKPAAAAPPASVTTAPPPAVAGDKGQDAAG